MDIDDEASNFPPSALPAPAATIEAVVSAQQEKDKTQEAAFVAVDETKMETRSSKKKTVEEKGENKTDSAEAVDKLNPLPPAHSSTSSAASSNVALPKSSLTAQWLDKNLRYPFFPVKFNYILHKNGIYFKSPATEVCHRRP
jgi:hypothetical protein